MKRNIVLYLGGGAMSGVFGAGVVTALEEMNVYSRIKAVYGESAGAINAAYFLSKQTHLGSSIYYEDLTSNFISSKNFFKGAYQRIYNRYLRPIPKDKMVDALNLDYLFRIIKNKKKLEVDNVFEMGIGLFIRVLNLKTISSEFIKATPENIMGASRASASAAPYCSRACNVDGSRCIDGAIMNPIDIGQIIENHPDDKIILVINGKIKRGKRDTLRSVLEGAVAQVMYPKPLFKIFKERENLFRKNIEEAFENDRVTVVMPPLDNPTKIRTINKEKLLKTYEMGKSAGKKLERAFNE